MILEGLNNRAYYLVIGGFLWRIDTIYFIRWNVYITY